MIVAILFSAALMADQAAPGGSAAPATAPVAKAGATAATPTKTAKADPERVCKLEPVLGSKIKKLVRDRFPKTTQRMGSLYLYGIMRGLTFRRMRVPKPQVALGTKL